jgi:hypothetical protein
MDPLVASDSKGTLVSWMTKFHRKECEKKMLKAQAFVVPRCKRKMIMPASY